MNLPIVSLINRYGKKVYWLKRTENIEDSTGEVYYTYPNTIELKCLINEVGGLLEIWYQTGRETETDLQLMFKPNTNTQSMWKKDRIILSNEDEYEIANVIKHGPISPDYIEVLVVRI